MPSLSLLQLSENASVESRIQRLQRLHQFVDHVEHFCECLAVYRLREFAAAVVSDCVFGLTRIRVHRQRFSVFVFAEKLVLDRVESCEFDASA